jgi:hypothetical protein
MCEQKERMSKVCYVSELARKAAVLDGCMYVVYQKKDGSYSFDRLGQEIKGIIVEYRHYL